MALRKTFPVEYPYFYFFKSQQFTQKDRTKLKKYLDIRAEERYHVYLFAQKTFIAGLTSGSVKG